MPLENEIKAGRYLKIMIITVGVSVVIMGGIFGTIYQKDQIVKDMDRLKRTVSIANAMHFKLSFGKGFMIMKPDGSQNGRKIDLPTLKKVTFKEKTIQADFQSLFFKDSIETKKPIP